MDREFRDGGFEQPEDLVYALTLLVTDEAQSKGDQTLDLAGQLTLL